MVCSNVWPWNACHVLHQRLLSNVHVDWILCAYCAKHSDLQEIIVPVQSGSSKVFQWPNSQYGIYPEFILFYALCLILH